MRNPILNIFIVDDNKLAVNGLKYYLQNRYGQCVQVYSFNHIKSCLEKLDGKIEIDVVIMDPHTYDNDPVTQKTIRSINPEAVVIPLYNNETIALMLERYKHGSQDLTSDGETACSSGY